MLLSLLWIAMPSLLFINQHYHPDFASTGQHLTDLAEHLVDDGFDVSILCSRGRYLAGEMDVPAEEVHNGVHIRRVRATSFGRDTHVGRIADYGSFYMHVLRHLLFGPSYDAVVTLTTPPLLCVAGAIGRTLRGQRYGIWSMDLHPDAEEAVGLIEPEGWLSRVLHRLNDWGYQKADFIVDLGAYMKQRIVNKGVPSSRLHTIPVWNKKDEVYPIPREENPLVKELGLEDKFVVMYSGNAGIGHRFDEVLEAMDALRDHPDIYFLFVGSGPQKERIEAFAKQHALTNFDYLPYFPREQIKYSLTIAHVHLLTLQTKMSGIAVPGKLYGILASGRPVLMVGPEASEPGQTIQNNDVGHVVDPKGKETTQQFVDYVLALYEDDTGREAMGAHGRTLFLNRFEQEVACDIWSDYLQTTVGSVRS